jgi:hypothetical protein
MRRMMADSHCFVVVVLVDDLRMGRIGMLGLWTVGCRGVEWIVHAFAFFLVAVAGRKVGEPCLQSEDRWRTVTSHPRRRVRRNRC